jgi:tetratricopeptide (TPR) repeat protein
VLRIERTADERAIKKAYFTLIREFPPDKAPEEFKKLREAYEVLSDPVARQRFDAVEKDFQEYGDELAERLRAIEEQIKQGGDAGAQAALKALLEEHPTLTIARENLAFSYMRTGAFAEALDQWKALSKVAPEEARYHFHKGLTFNRLDQPDKALKAVEKAHALKPDELRFHLAVIDLLLGQRNLTEALLEIDAGIERLGDTGDQVMVLRVRRVDALFSLGELGDADGEATRFFESVRKLSDPEAPRYFSSQLASIAAKLFARDEPLRANALLGRCKELNPAGTVDHPYPEVASLRLRDLPPEATDWLAQQTPGPTSPTFAEAVWPAKITSILGVCFALALLLYVLFAAPERWSVVGVVVTAMLLGSLFAALAYVVRDIVQLVKSPIRGFITVHPLYLVRARGDRLKVYPLFRLSKSHGVHQHTNGGYTHTAVTLHFGSEVIALTIRGKEYAQGWLNYFVGRRGRALELMAEGYLEAEQGVEMIPPAMLTRPSPSAAQEKATLKRLFGGAGAAALAALAVIVPLHAARADDYAYQIAVRAQPAPAYVDYLAAYPAGRHADEVKRAMGRPFDDAAAAIRAIPGGEKREVVAGLLTAIDALRAERVTSIPVVVKSSVELPHLPDSIDREATETYGGSGSGGHDGELVSRLQRIFEAAGLGATIRLVPSSDTLTASSPVLLTIRHKTTMDGKRFETPGHAAAPSMQAAWEAILTVRGRPAPVWKYDTISTPPAELRIDRPTQYESQQLAFWALERMEALAFDDFALEIAREVGLSEEPPRDAPPPSSARKKRSPYER